MRIWRGTGLSPSTELAGLRAAFPRPVVSIGVFDGVHRGHQKILAAARRRADATARALIAVTFDPIPERILRPQAAPPLLATTARRLALLEQARVDAVYLVEFTTEFAALTPDQFVKTVLADGLDASAVVVGANFRFGHRASGDVTTLTHHAGRFGYAVEAVDLLTLAVPAEPTDDADTAAQDDPRPAELVTVSSSWIRQQIAAGWVARAAVALGRLHRLEGEVQHGDHRGRSLGYPTANLAVAGDLALPADGVYAGWLDGMPAAISVGTNPTFGGTVRRVEAHVLDRNDLDYYGKSVTVDFARRIRGMVRFAQVDELRRQMDDDVARCRDILRTVTA